jgi:hypothetical protein
MRQLHTVEVILFAQGNYGMAFDLNIRNPIEGFSHPIEDSYSNNTNVFFHSRAWGKYQFKSEFTRCATKSGVKNIFIAQRDLTVRLMVSSEL